MLLLADVAPAPKGVASSNTLLILAIVIAVICIVAFLIIRNIKKKNDNK